MNGTQRPSAKHVSCHSKPFDARAGLRSTFWRASHRRPNNERVRKAYDDKVWKLTAEYNAAYRVHQSFSMAIAELAMAGERPPDLLQDDEKAAALELAGAAQRLRVALAKVAGESSAETQAKKIDWCRLV